MPASRLHQIPVPTPFYVGPVNIYLLEGEPLTLIDCGPNTAEAYDALVAGLASYSYQLADIEQIIITHHHTDHIGLTQRVVAESEAKLVAHQYTAPYLEHPRQTRKRDLDFLCKIYKEGGVPQATMQAIGQISKWVDQFGNLSTTPNVLVHEGDIIHAGARDWQVYYTPGHAGDLICLYDPASETLVASDHLILKISSNPLIEPAPTPNEPRPKRLMEYITHMQRIAALDSQIVYSGHGDPIYAVADLVAQRIDFHHQRAEHILGYFEHGPASLWDIADKMFAHVADEHRFLAISEVLGHIDILESENRLRREVYDEVIFWHR